MSRSTRACMEATYAKVDLLLAGLLTGDRPTKEDLAEFGDGGLCLRCPTCVFPACPFGK